MLLQVQVQGEGHCHGADGRADTQHPAELGLRIGFSFNFMCVFFEFQIIHITDISVHSISICKHSDFKIGHKETFFCHYLKYPEFFGLF